MFFVFCFLFFVFLNIKNKLCLNNILKFSVLNLTFISPKTIKIGRQDEGFLEAENSYSELEKSIEYQSGIF